MLVGGSIEHPPSCEQKSSTDNSKNKKIKNQNIKSDEIKSLQRHGLPILFFLTNFIFYFFYFLFQRQDEQSQKLGSHRSVTCGVLGRGGGGWK
jgi:hypothetical protein